MLKMGFSSPPRFRTFPFQSLPRIKAILFTYLFILCASGSVCTCTCEALSSQQRDQVRKQERGRDEEADRWRERREGGRELQQQQCAVRGCSRLEIRLLFAGKGERAAELPSDRARRQAAHCNWSPWLLFITGLWRITNETNSWDHGTTHPNWHAHCLACTYRHLYCLIQPESQINHIHRILLKRWSSYCFLCDRSICSCLQSLHTSRNWIDSLVFPCTALDPDRVEAASTTALIRFLSQWGQRHKGVAICLRRRTSSMERQRGDGCPKLKSADSIRCFMGLVMATVSNVGG